MIKMYRYVGLELCRRVWNRIVQCACVCVNIYDQLWSYLHTNTCALRCLVPFSVAGVKKHKWHRVGVFEWMLKRHLCFSLPCSGLKQAFVASIEQFFFWLFYHPNPNCQVAEQAFVVDQYWHVKKRCMSENDGCQKEQFKWQSDDQLLIKNWNFGAIYSTLDLATKSTVG